MDSIARFNAKINLQKPPGRQQPTTDRDQLLYFTGGQQTQREMKQPRQCSESVT